MTVFDLHLHDKAFPGPLGFAAFAAVKFGGYMLAGLVLRKVYPSIEVGKATIAGLRIGLGILLGPAFVLTVAYLAAHFHWNSDSVVAPYVALICLRVLVWAFVIWILIRRTVESRRYLWVNAGAGAVWSSLLDIPAFVLLAVSPGTIPIC